MFERYTEEARRTIFFARYEASQFGSQQIESEHLLLGLLRQATALMDTVMQGRGNDIRKEIEATATVREKVSTSVDLPVSHEVKRCLAYASEEAERASSLQIEPGHLALGLMREEKSLAAQLLCKYGVTREAVLQQIASQAPADSPDGAGLPEISRKRKEDAVRRAGRGHFTRTRQEGSTEVSETHHFLNGHEIVVVERLRLSEDGRSLSYTQEISGPGKAVSHAIEFDVA